VTKKKTTAKKEIPLPIVAVEPLPETRNAAIAGLHLHFKNQAYNNAVALFEAFLSREQTSVSEAYHWIVSRKDAISQIQ
jgi:hypothetical protein